MKSPHPSGRAPPVQTRDGKPSTRKIRIPRKSRELAFLPLEGREAPLAGPEEIVLATMGPGEFFGEMCILECMPRAATIRTLEATELHAISNGDLHKLFRRWPAQYAILMLNISRDLCRRLRAVHELLCQALVNREPQGRLVETTCRLE